MPIVYGTYGSRPYGGGYSPLSTVLTSSKSCFIQGALVQVSVSQPAYILAPEPLTDNQPAHIFGHYVATDNQICYIQSYIDNPTDTQPSFINGYLSATDNQSCFIQIENPVTIGPKRAYIRGRIAITPTAKNAWIYGHYVATDTQPAFIQIYTPMQDGQPSYVLAPTPVTPFFRSYICGLESQSTSRNAFMFGVYKVFPTQPAFIRVGEPIASSQSCYLQIETPTFDNNLLFVRGLGNFVVGQLCYIDYKIPIFAPTQPAFVQIETRITSLKRSFVQIETPITSVKRCHVRSLGDAEQPQQAYIKGALKASDSQPCYIHLPTVVTENQSCFMEGTYPTIRGTALCYVYQTGIVNPSKICYLNGTHVGEVDNVRNAFINGSSIHHFIPSAVLCWVNGHISFLRDNQSCFIFNQGLIGEWRLDDGQFDYGSAITNDYSTIDHDGININFPEYVEGPYREDCNDA